MRLHLHGDLSQISVTAGLPESLSLSPATSKRSTDAALQLPDMGGLTQVSSLELCNNAGHQPISLQHLSQFPRLESLSLWGNFCDLEQLAQCTELKSLSLRFMPNLRGLPPLQSWPGLDSFIACNVEEATGKRLRQQLKERAKHAPGTNTPASASCANLNGGASTTEGLFQLAAGTRQTGPCRFRFGRAANPCRADTERHSGRFDHLQHTLQYRQRH